MTSAGDELSTVLLRLGSVRRLAAREVLHAEGSFVDTLCLLVQGALVMALDGDGSTVVAHLRAGDLVGLSWFLTRKPADAFVVAHEATEVCVVARSAVDALLQTDRGFGGALLGVVGHRLALLEAEQRADELARQHHRANGLFDPLTSAHSRRWLEHAAPRLVARHQLDHEPLSALVLDLDHFKRFNDAHGHAAGDEALRQVVQLTWRFARVSDFIARTRGEEFVVLLSSTALDEAAQVAERLRAAIAEAAVPPMSASLPPVTVSIGVASHRWGDEAAAFVERARVAMYEAKLAGRNRVSVSPQPQR